MIILKIYKIKSNWRVIFSRHCQVNCNRLELQRDGTC